MASPYDRNCLVSISTGVNFLGACLVCPSQRFCSRRRRLVFTALLVSQAIAECITLAWVSIALVQLFVCGNLVSYNFPAFCHALQPHRLYSEADEISSLAFRDLFHSKPKSIKERLPSESRWVTMNSATSDLEQTGPDTRADLAKRLARLPHEGPGRT